MSIKFPIMVKAIEFDHSPLSEPYQEKLLLGGKCGDFVVVRPCDPKFEGKTFLGILIGSIALSQGVQSMRQDAEEPVGSSHAERPGSPATKSAMRAQRRGRPTAHRCAFSCRQQFTVPSMDKDVT